MHLQVFLFIAFMLCLCHGQPPPPLPMGLGNKLLQRPGQPPVSGLGSELEGPPPPQVTPGWSDDNYEDNDPAPPLPPPSNRYNNQNKGYNNQNKGYNNQNNRNNGYNNRNNGYDDDNDGYYNDNDGYNNDNDGYNNDNGGYNDDDDNNYDTDNYRSSRNRRVPDEYGNINIYVRDPQKYGKSKKYKKLRFPVNRFKAGHFPPLPPLISFLPWLPIFADKLTKQTIIFSPTGGLYIIPPLINFYGQLFSVAELIASGYASLVSTGAPPPPAVNVAPLVGAGAVVGPGVPPPNAATGGFVGGVQTKFGAFHKTNNGTHGATKAKGPGY